DAMAQTDVALSYDPNYAEAHLLKAQLLLGRRDFPAAGKELEQYQQTHPEDKDAARLADLCREGHIDDPVRLTALVEVLLRQEQFALVETLVQTQDRLLEVYRKRVEAAWPGLGTLLTKDPDGSFSLNLYKHKEIANLGP